MSRNVRRDFPMLSRRGGDGRFIYLDSAATALKPKAVIEAQRSYDETLTANIHRGSSYLAEEASFRYETARRTVARYIGARPSETIFTLNASHALEMVARGIDLSADDIVLCAMGNHHSNLLPWMRLAKVRYVDGDPLGALDPAETRAALRRLRPRVLAFSWVSNVNGGVSPAQELCRLAKEHGAISVVDGAQAAPHLAIDVERLGCDFLAFSGHKMLGPAGTGVLWGRADLLERLEPLALGGGAVNWVSPDGYGMKNLPHRLESGTPNISGVYGLGAAADYLEELGREFIEGTLGALAAELADCLSDLPGARFAAATPGPPASPIVSIAPFDTHVSTDLISRLLSDTYGVISRSGFLCARPSLMEAGFTTGVVRFSAHVYNTRDEIRAAGRALREVLHNLVR